MEHWILDYDATYEAVRWPFAKSWDDFVRSPEPLVLANEDFGRNSPSDGLDEMPSVPATLPRPVPQGRYRFAVYHDATHLYAFLDAEDAPDIVPLETIHHIAHIGKLHPMYPSIAFLSNDERLLYRFGVDGNGQKAVKISLLADGPRRREPPATPPAWDFISIPKSHGELSCWRIVREHLADMLAGNRLRFSVARNRLETLEAVAWGAHTGWEARQDEMGVMKLVEERTTPARPSVRRVDLRYDPMTERGRFQIHWTAPYDNEFAGTQVQVHPKLSVDLPWQHFSFRLNGEECLVDLAANIETREFAIQDGHNHVEISAARATARRFFFEKRSGNRIAESVLPAQPARSSDWVMSRIRTECENYIRHNAERRAQGTERKFMLGEAFVAAALGRVYKYLHPEPRLLDVVRDVADFMLTMQRPDGTFSGLHLAQYGVTPKPWSGGAYDSGPVGELWVVAGALLKEEKYLNASRRLVEAYKDYRLELNHNYAAFALYHLAAHYRLTRDPLALEHGLYYAKNCVAIDLLPLGFHRGHNFYSEYGNIVMRGMAMFCGALPESEPYRAVLREQCIRMANQIISRLQPDGLFDARTRRVLGRRLWIHGLFSVGLLLERENTIRFDAIAQRMLHAREDLWASRDGTERIALNDFVLYYAHRDKLLTGEKIDCANLL